MARTVRDAALVLAALAGTDAHDPATHAIPASLLHGLTTLKPGALKGARLGIVRHISTFNARMDPLLDGLIATLRAAGAEIIDPVTIPSLAKLGQAPSTVLSYEFKDGLNRYLATPGRVTPMHTLADLIAFNTAHAAAELRFFGQELFTAAQARGPLTDKPYLEARSACLLLTRTEGIDTALATHRLDALVYFTKGTATLTDHLNGEGSSGGSSTLAAVAGYPSVTVPAAHVFGLPIGLTFTGSPWSDARLLALAADFETHTKARTEPRFHPTSATP
jgi:amidase